MKGIFFVFLAIICNEHVTCGAHTIDELYNILDAAADRFYRMEAVVREVRHTSDDIKKLHKRTKRL